MSAPQSAGRQPIAIVGMSGRFPGARSLADFWRNVRDGVESLDTFSDAELTAAGIDETLRSRPGWVRRGTVLEDADRFDAAFFGYSPREAQIIDPQQRLFLECAWEALEHAGYGSERPGTTVGVYAGASINTYLVSQILADRALAASVGGYQLMLGNDKDFLCTRVSYKLDLHGPSMTIQTACSTSLVAVQVACRALQRLECDMALAGGVSITFPQRTGYEYQEGMIFSPDGTCRPFDTEARGTRVGAGAGVVVLKRLSDALADRDTIHAVILGAAINNDGAGKAGYTAPSLDGQMDVIATAQALAGVTPRSISYIEAHGTATPLGDPIEVTALTRVFRASTSDRTFCALGSLKANIGHLDAAAGVAGLIKTVLALEYGEIPPLPHFRTPNPQLELPTSPFRVPASAEAWTSNDGPRRAGVSSFGIGGTNAHVVLEEAPLPPVSVTHRTHHVLTLSARTADALATATVNLVEHLRATPAAMIADVANTLQLGRRVFPHRRSVVVRDRAEAIDVLTVPERSPVLSGVHEGAARPVAFLFSGQGSQHAGMCRELYRDEAVFRDAFDRCADLVQPVLGRDLRDVLSSSDDAEMSATELAQVLLFSTEYALATLWMTWGVQPAAMLGHSVGEYVAAHLAGVFSLEDAIAVVAARGRLMQALPSGAMVAVSLPVDDLRSRLRPGVEVAAVNAPTLCSVSGSHEAMADFTRQLVDAGIEHRALHTSHAFHSAMMEPVLAPFREVVARVALSAPRRPYISNVTGTWIRPEQATSPDYYVSHLRGAVLFAEGVTALTADQSTVLLEVGPGTALSSLARLSVGREGATRVISSQPHPREPRPQAEALMTAVARLWTSGVSIDWDGLHRDERLRRVPLPSYPFERKRHWIDRPPAAPEAASAASYRHEHLRDWFHVPTWTRLPMAAASRRTVDGTWLIFGDHAELTTQTTSLLQSNGATVVVVNAGAGYTAHGDGTYTLRAHEDDDYSALIGDLRSRGLRLSGAVHLWNTGVPPSGNEASYPLHSVMALGRMLIRDSSASPVRVVVATTGAQSVLGEPVTCPSRALVTGPVIVLPTEHDNLRTSAIDLGDLDVQGWSASAARAILDEVTADTVESLVAWRAGVRWTRRYADAAVPEVDPAALPLKERGVYLITGGTGGIGLTLARWLAARVSARVLLTSRRALPAAEMWDSWVAAHEADDPTSVTIANLRQIEAAGGEVLVAAADVADEPAMRRAVDAALARWGSIDGVIHSAGVAGGSAVAFSDRAETEQVLRAKVEGTQVIARLFASAPLDFCVLFSSINAVVGAPGGSVYGAACAYLDAFAVSSRRPATWRRTLSIAWDAWRDVGMAERVVVPVAMRAARRAYVAAGISPDQGADAFGRALATGLPQFVVSPYDVDRILREQRRALGHPPSPVERPTDLPESATPPAARSTGTFMAPAGRHQVAVAAMWEDLLGVHPVGAGDNFFDLGGHSLLATRVLARIDDHFGVRLPLRAIFDAPTVEQLSSLIAAQGHEPEAASDLVASGDREEFEL